MFWLKVIEVEAVRSVGFWMYFERRIVLGFVDELDVYVRERGSKDDF